MSQQNQQTQSQISSTQMDDNSLFRIMIASDNHLGYLENDQIRGDDSFNSFEEVLKISKAERVDFLLLGGDLFHHHNPSKKTIIRTSNILQKYVYGQRSHKYEVYCYEPNFKNKNLSVDIPIFIIHGNHDDPSGFENFSSIDIFSNKEVNYFGKIKNFEQFDLYPILFVKGNTKIALYGIGNMKDERLYLALQNKKVNFHRPDDYKNWFNILIVHQNRFKGHNIGKNKKNYLPESFIPSFFDLVIWGHEHECFTEPVFNSEVGFHVYQPGSSVATSLIQAESKPKHIGLCEINNDKFRIIPVKLETVRPFIYNQYELKQYEDRIKTNEDIEKIIEEKIEEALQEVEKGRSTDPKEYNELLPIIRIKIEYTGYSMTRTNFLVGKYSGKIANLNDAIQFWKKNELYTIKKTTNEMDIDDYGTNVNNENAFEAEIIDNESELKQFVVENISNFFSEKNKKNFLNTDIFCDYLDKSVNGNEKHSIEILFRQFYETAISTTKIESDIITQLQPLDNPKKEFTDIVEQLINKTDVNTSIANGVAREMVKYGKGKRRSSSLINNNTNNINHNEMLLNKGIHLQRMNNFSNEKRIVEKMEKNVSQNGFDFMGVVEKKKERNEEEVIDIDCESSDTNNRSLLDYLGDRKVNGRKSADEVEVVINNNSSFSEFEELNYKERNKRKSQGIKGVRTRGNQYKVEPKRPGRKKKK